MLTKPKDYNNKKRSNRFCNNLLHLCKYKIQCAGKVLLVLTKGSFLSADIQLVSQHGKQRGQEALVNLVNFLSALSNTIAIRHGYGIGR